MDRETVINGLCDAIGIIHAHVPKRYWGYGEQACRDAIALLKEQEAMNVDAFVQCCIDSHIMGDATVREIKYWAGKYKEIKEGRVKWT